MPVTSPAHTVFLFSHFTSIKKIVEVVKYYLNKPIFAFKIHFCSSHRMRLSLKII